MELAGLLEEAEIVEEDRLRLELSEELLVNDLVSSVSVNRFKAQDLTTLGRTTELSLFSFTLFAACFVELLPEGCFFFGFPLSCTNISL